MRKPVALEIPASVDALQQAMAGRQYIAGRGLAVSAYLALRLQRPLFLEGEPGVGKTEVAKVLASALGTELIRLQCYEGLDISHAVYEWNYPRQILEIRLLEGAHALDPRTAERELFTDTFLIKRPLLRAIEQTRDRPPVLLIDEIDRADEEFEGYLLELLSDFQITIPELGTIRADEPPVVVITSNRTREVHDALKRRCVYCWIDYPSAESSGASSRPGCPASGPSGRPGDRVRAGTADRRALQDRGRFGDARLGGSAGGARSGRARRRNRRGNARHPAQEPGRHPGGPRRADSGHAQPRTGPGRRLVNLAANVLLFGRMLRRAGLDIHHGRLLDAVRALEWVNVGSRADTAAALRSLLVHDRDEIARFDRAFELFFKAHRPPAPGLPLFSLGERPRVVARPAPGVPIQTEFEGVQAGLGGLDACGRRLERDRRVAHERLRASSPHVSSSGPGRSSNGSPGA